MQRMTKQKRVLHEAIQQMDGFFNAQELHSNVKTKRIGLATVYRFLADLDAKSQIHAFICENKKIYSVSKKSHAHFTCERCGDVKHIKIQNVDFLQEAKDDVCHFQLELSGVCSECK